jgi:hypothetical protein|tara:strand:+ start:1196 stop:1711 length:516 start_codon:yes stop_codon:yes gene_type:complete
MTTRSIFNRRYSSFRSDGTTVFLANGQGNVTAQTPVIELVAGDNFSAGTPVYPSGTFVVPGIAASGVDTGQISIVGFSIENATTGNPVQVALDGVVDLTAANLTAESSLSAGQYYYLSKFRGEVVKFSTASGLISGSGTDAYSASVPLGLAINTTQLSIELNNPVLLHAGV